MNAVYAIAISIGLAGILFAVINIIYPIKRLGIPTRKRGALVLVASFSLVVVAGVLNDPAKQTDQSVAVQPPPSAVDDEASTVADNRAPKTANSVTTADPGPEESSRTGVVTDRFTLHWELDGTDLLLAIDTDLPDTAEVIVSVDRRYYQVGDADAYSRYYFMEKGLISKWRSPRRIPLDDHAWRTDLTTHQSEMAALSNDLAFEIDRIEDQVGVRAVVHVNKPDERFGGRGNPNLAGGAVSRLGDNRDWNIIKAGTQIPLPLAGDMPASATDSAPSQPKQGVRTDSSSTSRNTIDSRVYIVADEKDHSFGNVRSRVTLEIEAHGATTERAQIETMMNAAIERHRKDWPDAVSVRLWGSYRADQVITNSIDYAADGCGWTGDDCTGRIWAKPHKGNVPAELTEWGTPTDGEREAGKDLQCRQDLQCWGDKHLLKATFACQPMIENLAKYDYEWTDGWLEAKLQRFRWKDRKTGTLSYTGNRVKFQNGFGAWQRITYWCHFDPATGFSEVSVQ